MAAITRRHLFGGLLASLGLAMLGPRDGRAGRTSAGDFVIVDGWVLRRSDLDLLR